MSELTPVTADSAIMHPKEKIIALKCELSCVAHGQERVAHLQPADNFSCST